MKVFMRKDLVNVGVSGEIVEVDRGYAVNFLIPKGFALEITPHNENSFKMRAKTVDRRQEVIATATSLLGQKVKEVKLVIKRKMHHDGKLYGAINQSEIIDLLKEKGIALSKNQIQLDKTIKNGGLYTIPIHLTARLKTELTIEVVSE